MSGDWGALAEVALVRLEWGVLLYFLLVNSAYLVLLGAALIEMREHLLLSRSESRWRLLGSEVAPRISVLAPAYNEAGTIVESLRSLLALHYPGLEVVVVNDGSSDDTLQVMLDHFELVPIQPIYQRRIACQPVSALYRSRSYANLVVLDKVNGGKADALNAGLNLSTGDLVCAIDADTLIESDSLQRMVRPFIQRDDVVAAGGTIRVANGSEVRGGRVIRTRAPRRPLAGIQVVEYLRAFLFGRLGWNRLGGNLIISGAFGLFRRDAVLDAGGYVHDTVGEDMELALRLRRVGYDRGGRHRIAFIPDPVAWTEVPETLRTLGRQRDRWHRGLADVLWRHRRVLFNPRYGAMGLLVFPYYVFVELLAPAVEAIGLLGLVVGISLGMIDVPFAVLFFLTAYALGAVLTVMTLALEEGSFHRYDRFADRLLLVLWALLENVGYRQMTVIWRLRGLVRYLLGRSDWGVMERRGFHRLGSALRPTREGEAETG